MVVLSKSSIQPNFMIGQQAVIRLQYRNVHTYV